MLARRNHEYFVSDPSHPGLVFKKLAGSSDLWSVRVGLKYRAVGRRTGDAIKWHWIGPHGEFDKLFS